MTIAYLLDANSEKILSIGTNPDLHKELLKKREHGEWQFPVIIRIKDAKQWDDEAYLATMRPDPAKDEAEEIKLIRQAHKHKCYTMRAIADRTGIRSTRVSELVHKYSITTVTSYWRAEKYDNPNGIVTGLSAKALADKICANVELINNARGTNDTVCGYYISHIPRIR